MGAIAQERGRLAEQAAADYLSGQGWRILARNERTPVGELDLVCEDQNTVVVVEVKGRSGDSYGHGLEAIGPRKERRLRAAAIWWMAGRESGPRPVRFDVIVVGLDGRGGLRCLFHYRDMLGLGR